jgi:hypothetical protein
MMRKTILLFTALLGACSPQVDDDVVIGDGEGKGDISGEARGALGAARPYAGDGTLAAQESSLRADMRVRRSVAWGRVATILAPAAIPGCPEGANRPEICDRARLGDVATWQTWYDRVESQDMARYLADRGLQPTDANIDSAFKWNAERVAEGGISERYVGFLNRLQQQGGTPGDFEGFLGIRSAYSPQLIRHALKNASQLRRCSGESESGIPTASLSSSNHAQCLTSEFPFDAATVKAQWERIESSATRVRVYDTSGGGLTRRLNRATNPRMSWETADGSAQPTADQIYTITTSDGVRYRLTSLHLVTKELRHWLWITLWWSSTPNDDFGADRPASIRGVWSNYKMAVTVGYDEEDRRDPMAVFADAPSLGAAIRSAQAGYDPAQLPAGASPPTWNSNPFLEFPAEAAPTNCIGCHQHAGTGRSDSTILDPNNLHGRRNVRDTFPFDYLFSTRELVQAR